MALRSNEEVRMDRRGIDVIMLAAALGMALANPASSSGFATYEQSARAMGMASAATTQTDEPSALFYNVGAAAFASGRALAVTAIQPLSRNASFAGRPPDSGVTSVFDQQSPDLSDLRASAFWVEPLGSHLRLGLAIYTPFFLNTSWGQPERFAGRDVATDAEIFTLDINPSIALRWGRFGIGLGAIYRLASLDLSRRLTAINPFNSELIDFARMDVTGGQDGGLGWNAGIHHQVSGRFAWGLAYRSGIDIDFGGDGVLTQIPTGNDQLDELLAVSTPFDQDLPLRSRIEFPATASFGIGVGLSGSLRLALDANWTEWSKVQSLPLAFPTFSIFDDDIALGFADTMSYRLGAELTTASGTQWRFGFAMEESPQPLATVGPVIADGDSTLFALGFGKDWLDIGLSYVDFDDRVVPAASTGDANESYQQQALLLAITVKKKP